MRTLLLLVALIGGLLVCGGCATTPVKVVCTPLAVARDIVDLPFATLGSACKKVGATRSGIAPSDVRSGFGYGYNSIGGWGPGLGISVDVTGPAMRGLSYVFGVPDYLVCRSIYPNFPKGVSPWIKIDSYGETDEPWGEFLFPNTRALWKEE
jgi:hypothetical protein